MASDHPSQDDTKSQPAGRDEVPIRRIGDFDLVREIGRGGMGIVYEARQRSLNRPVALKLLPPGLGLTPKAVARFQREALAAAQLHHTNIVPVYASGEESAHHYYVMELIEGQSLDRVLDDLRGGASTLMEQTVTQIAGQRVAAGGARSPAGGAGAPAAGATAPSSGTAAEERRLIDTAAHLAAEVAGALDCAHKKGILHRDIKPANLMLSRNGQLCITDFGLARITEEPSLTMSGLLMGSPAYMSPEQVTAGRTHLDHRTDVYSLGVVLYEMLTLRKPFEGATREALLTSILTKDPARPRSLNPRVPLDLETICLKAMEKDPDRRYATAAAMEDDLRRYLDGALITARRAGPVRRAAKFIRRHPLSSTMVVAALLVAVTGGVAWQGWRVEARARAERALRDAQLALDAGDELDALALADQALGIAPDLENGRLVRAQILIRLGRAPEAISEARKMLRTDPGNLAAHLVLARVAGTVPGVSREEELRRIEERFPAAVRETGEVYYLRALLARTDEEALDLLDRAIDLEPADGEALEARARRLMGLRRLKEAGGDCDRLITARPRDASGRLLKADLFLAMGETTRALAEIDRAVALDPEDPRGYLWRATLRCQGDFKNIDRAIADLDRAISLDPQNARYYRARAWCNYQFRRDKDAVEDARRAIALGPESSVAQEASWWLGVALHRLGRDDEARQAADRHERLAASWPEPRQRRNGLMGAARLRSAIGDAVAALADADKAIELADSAWEPYQVRAMLRRSQKDERGLAADCDVVAAAGVDDPEPLLARAISLRETCGRLDRALEDLDRIVERAPDWPRAWVERGLTKVKAGRQEDALADYARAIELAPAFVRARNARGWVLNALHRPQEALADFDAAIRLEPNKFAACNRAYALHYLTRLREAVAAFDQCLEFDPRDAENLTNLGMDLLDLGEAAAALARFSKAAEIAPKLVHARMLMATAHAAQGDCGKAADELQAAEAIGLEGPEAKYNFSLILSQEIHYFCPSLADPRKAIALLEDVGRSVSWKAYPIDNVLGLAYLRAGENAKARAALRRYLDEREGDATDWLWLAMAAWRIGRQDEARSAYEKGRQWLQAHPDWSASPGLRKTMEETSSLLGR